MMVAPLDTAARHPGRVRHRAGSIIPGMYGLEAGQSAVGDIFNWFVNYLPRRYGRGDTHAKLTREAEQLQPGESGLMALDWNNGNRTILVDPLLTGPAGRPDAAHHGARSLPGAGRSHGLRRADDHQPLRGVRRHRQGGRQLRRHRREEPVRHADLRRCLQPADEDQPLGADLRPGRGDLRRGRRRGLQEGRPGAAEDDRRQGHVYPPTRRTRQVYAELYRIYRELHDAFGASGRQERWTG